MKIIVIWQFYKTQISFTYVPVSSFTDRGNSFLPKQFIVPPCKISYFFQISLASR